MRHLLRRHPLPIQAFFRSSLVLTYSVPPEVVRPLLPPALCLDTWDGHAFVAIAMVDTAQLRPLGLPRWLGQDFALIGYRVFSRLAGAASLRGLRILRSDTNRARMVLAGNLLTRYEYRLATVETAVVSDRLEVRVSTPRAEADLHVLARVGDEPAAPPAGSPFRTLAEARRFAGPLPYTFDHEPETGSLVLIRASRQRWDPRPVDVEVRRLTFLERPPFDGVRPRLAAAFHVADVPYRWERGRLISPALGRG